MTKWEYLRVETKTEVKGFTDFQWIVERANGKDMGKKESALRGTKYPNLDEYLTQIGADGWELAGTLSHNNSTGMLLFKRLLAE